MGGRGAMSASGRGVSENAASRGSSAGYDIDEIAYEWSGNEFRKMRRASLGQGDAETVKRARAMDGWLDEGVFHEDIYRGTNWTHEKVSDLKSGDMLPNHGMASWSSDKGIAESFSTQRDNVPVVLVLKGGTSHGRDISQLSEFEKEKEVAVSSKQQLRAVNQYKGGKRRGGKRGIMYIEVEEV